MLRQTASDSLVRISYIYPSPPGVAIDPPCAMLRVDTISGVYFMLLPDVVSKSYHYQ